MSTFSTAWLWLSVLATLCILPAFLAIPYFLKNYQVKPDVFMTWYFAGVSVGVALWIWFSGRGADLFPEKALNVIAAMLVIGLTFGAVANSSLFKSIALAPNPGLPPVIYSASSVVVFVASALLASHLPRYFNPVNTDIDRFVGILFVIGGLFLVAGGWPLVRRII